MGDGADRAQAVIDNGVAQGIRNIRQQLTHYPAPIQCLNCYEPLPKQFLCEIPRRWCDSECCEDWEKLQR